MWSINFHMLKVRIKFHITCGFKLDTYPCSISYVGSLQTYEIHNTDIVLNSAPCQVYMLYDLSSPCLMIYFSLLVSITARLLSVAS